MIYYKLTVSNARILSSKEAYTCIPLKRIDILSQNISAVKKGRDKKMQVTEQSKDVISLWGQEKSYTN